jgi:5-deoxy-glucuronate isomerase
MSKNLVPATAATPGRTNYIHPGNSSMQHASYGRIRLNASFPTITFANAQQETGLICLSGACTIVVNNKSFSLATNDSLYIPKNHTVTIATDTTADLVECSAPVAGDYPIQFIPYADILANSKLHFTAGTPGAQRAIDILLGANIHAGRLVAGITRSLPGNWTSWPPHEHAAMLEEIYVYIDMPSPAFGMQLVYTNDITPDHVDIVREGDAILLPAGYHPNVAIPGHTLNFIWIMVAHREVVDRQWGVVNNDPRFA